MSTTRKKTPKTGPGALAASSEARRRATVILETLAGVRTTEEAAQALEVAPARYYQLEAYALQGFLVALEPKQRGRQVSVEQQNERPQNEIARLEREVRRRQALYRTMQRALGVPRLLPATAAKAALARGGKKVKRRRRTTRGDRVLAALSKASTPEDVEGET